MIDENALAPHAMVVMICAAANLGSGSHRPGDTQVKQFLKKTCKLVFAFAGPWIRNRPLLLLQLCIFLFWDLSTDGITSLVLACIASEAMILITYEAADWRQQRRMSRFLDQFAGCKLVAVRLSDAVDAKLALEVGYQALGGDLEQLWKKLLGHLRYTQFKSDALRDQQLGGSLLDIANSNILIYVVRRTTGTKPQSWTTFPKRFGAYIFLTDHPNELRGAGRFSFYHELGHVSATADYPYFQGWLGVLPFAGAWSWHFSETMWPSGAAIASALYLLFGLVLYVGYWKPLELMGDGFHEEWADTFGLVSLSPLDQQRAGKALRKYPPRITASELKPTHRGGLDKIARNLHAGRLRLLRQNLQLIEVGKGTALKWPPILEFVLRHVPEWFMLAATIGLAFFARPLNFPGAHLGPLTELSGVLIFLYYSRYRVELKNKQYINDMTRR
jgi:hypothetical protein